MSTLHRRLGTLLVALALAPLSAPAAPAAPRSAPTLAPATGATYAADVSAYLDSIRWYERSLKGVPRPSDPLQREFVDAFMASMSSAQFYAKAMPVFKRYITPEQAAALGAMARKRPVPLGKQQAAMQAHWDMEKKAVAELRSVVHELSDAYAQRMRANMVAEIRRSITDLAEHRGTAYVPKVNKVGLSYLDRLAWLTVSHVWHQMKASDTMDRACVEAGIETVLIPANLMAQNGIAAARQAFDGCERALETMEKTNERVFAELRTDMLALKLPSRAGLAEQLDQRAREFYEFSLKYGELNRQLLATYRRSVSLVEEKRSSIQVDGERMLFETDEDVNEANRNADEGRALAKAINDLVYAERQKGVLRNIDLNDGISAEGPVDKPAAAPAEGV